MDNLHEESSLDESYVSNSRYGRENSDYTQKDFKVETVGGASMKSKSASSTVMRWILSDLKDAVDCYYKDSVKPGVKKFLADKFSGLAYYIFLGPNEAKKKPKPSSFSDGEYYSYSSYFDSETESYVGSSASSQKRKMPERPRNDAPQIFFRDTPESTGAFKAAKAKHEMQRIIGHYHFCTLGKLYEIAKLESEYTDYNWGWSNVDTVRVAQMHGGAYLMLPEIQVNPNWRP